MSTTQSTHEVAVKTERHGPSTTETETKTVTDKVGTEKVASETADAGADSEGRPKQVHPDGR